VKIVATANEIEKKTADQCIRNPDCHWSWLLVRKNDTNPEQRYHVKRKSDETQVLRYILATTVEATSLAS